MPFQATARIPCRPLSTDNQSLAEPKELLVNYKTGTVRICKEDGSFVDMGESIRTAIIESIKNDTNLVKNITIAIDGKNYVLETVVIDNIKNIEELKTSLGYTKKGNVVSLSIINGINNKIKSIEDSINSLTGSGSDGTSISADKIKDSDTRFMMTKDEKNIINGIIESASMYITLNANAWQQSTVNGITVYTQVVDHNEKFTQIYLKSPIVNVVLSDNVATAITELNEYSKIFSVFINDNNIIVNALERPTCNLKLIALYDMMMDAIVELN